MLRKPNRVCEQHYLATMNHLRTPKGWRWHRPKDEVSDQVCGSSCESGTVLGESFECVELAQRDHARDRSEATSARMSPGETGDFWRGRTDTALALLYADVVVLDKRCRA